MAPGTGSQENTGVVGTLSHRLEAQPEPVLPTETVMPGTSSAGSKSPAGSPASVQLNACGTEANWPGRPVES